MPEILWSPIFNIIDSFLQNSNNVKVFRSNFFTNPDNIYPLIYIILLQFVGILGVSIILFKAKVNSRLKILLVPIMIILTLFTGLILYIVYSFRHGISF